MSNKINDALYDRASYCLDQLESHPAGLDDAIIKALSDNDMEALHHAVVSAEACLAQEEFYAGDVY